MSGKKNQSRNNRVGCIRVNFIEVNVNMQKSNIIFVVVVILNVRVTYCFQVLGKPFIIYNKEIPVKEITILDSNCNVLCMDYRRFLIGHYYFLLLKKFFWYYLIIISTNFVKLFTKL